MSYTLLTVGSISSETSIAVGDTVGGDLGGSVAGGNVGTGPGIVGDYVMTGPDCFVL